MKGVWIWAAAALAAAACTADGGDREAATGEEEPARESPARPPEADLAEGMYVLESINGGELPGVVQEEGGCRLEVVDGSLVLQAGRFAFQNRTREVCGPTTPEPVMHAAGGSYIIDDGRIVLSTDVGAAFSEASGTVDSTTVMLRRLSTEAGTETVTWQLRRDDSQSVSLPGSREGEDAADMSRTPGVTSGG